MRTAWSLCGGERWEAARLRPRLTVCANESFRHSVANEAAAMAKKASGLRTKETQKQRTTRPK
jgi:hypothetical protein